MSSNTNTNFKVGITITVFSIILATFILWLSQFNPGKDSYKIHGVFDNVGGLIPGSKVYYLGVSVGSVVAIVPDFNQVLVEMDIDSTIKIPTSTRLSITSKGIVGDKCVEFFKSQEHLDKTDFYKADSSVKGFAPASVEDMIFEAKKVMLKAQDLIGNAELRRNILDTTKNIEKFSKNLNDMSLQLNEVTANVKVLSTSANGFIKNTNEAVNDINKFVNDLNNLTLDNQQNINTIIAKSAEISKSLSKTADNINNLLGSAENQKDFKFSVKSVRNTADNIEKISAQAEKIVTTADKISSDIRDITGDPNFKKNIKDIVANTSSISGTFANPLANTDATKKDGKNNLNAEFRSEILPRLVHTFKENTSPSFDFVANFNMLVETGFDKLPFLQLGVEEIGPKNQFNLQAGFYPFDNFRVRLGLIRGRLGGGTNYFYKKTNTELIGELYDISSPWIRIGILQNIYQDYGLTFYWNNQLLTNTNEFNLGFRWQPDIYSGN